MGKPGPSSFRRILLSRILLLSVPVLLLGVLVTYYKARSSLQEIARQNLADSAVRKGETIRDSIAGLQANLVTASETVVLQSGNTEQFQKFLARLAAQFPNQVHCTQLTDAQTKKLAASTCGEQAIGAIPVNKWPQRQNQLLLDRSSVNVTAILPANQPQGVPQSQQKKGQTPSTRLLLSAPVYNRQGNLRYVLSVESDLLQSEQVKREKEKAKQGYLSGNTVVIDQDGTILAHPIAERVGRNIQNEEDADRLKSIVKHALAGENNFLHLFFFEHNKVELLVGYTAIDSPITSQPNHKWVILAFTRRDDALSELRDIRYGLIILTLCLIAANLLATLYISRVLARPLEKLTAYALHNHNVHSTEPVPHDFKIREFNQLAEALDSMVERLKAWAEEIETAWKEAQAANHLKNQFLANTSHELRTPLNAIINCIRLVQHGYCDNREEELDFLQRADDAAIHLLGIINDVLDIARIESGKVSVVMEPVDLRNILKEVINLQAVTIQHKGLELKTPDLKEPIAVRADPAKLRQVLLNVVGNAAKFTEKGSITISTRIEQAWSKAHPAAHTSLGDKASLEEKVNGNGHVVDGKTGAEDDGGKEANSANVPISSSPSRLSSSPHVIVSIQDTGIGIDRAQQHKLFRPFVMVDGSTTRKFGGTGLGLAISRNLIELMGGSINLYSDGEGHGTTVEIALPTIDNSLLPSVESTEGSESAEVSVATDTKDG